MKMRMVPFAAVAAVLNLAPAAPAEAGAWTAAPGAVFFSQSKAFETYSTPRVRLDSYAEFGWREGVTIGGSTSRPDRPERPSFAPEGGLTTQDGFGRASLFVRGRVWSGPSGEVASLEFEAAGGSQGDAPDATVRARFGKGFGTPIGNAFVDADLGWRADAQASEGRLLGGATLGVTPAPGWMAMVRASLDAAPFAGGAAEETGLSATLVRELDDGASMSLTVGATAWSRDGRDSAHVRLGVWRRF